MSNVHRILLDLTSGEVLGHASSAARYASCESVAEGRCITCSDEAVRARVLRVNQEAGVAFVAVEDATEEVDISLVDDVVQGDMLLVHGGVAISRLDEANDA
jgi:hydrogenase maturation factor